MFIRISKKIIPVSKIIRKYSSDKLSERLKITVCGANSQTGQIVSFFLKQSQYNLDISLYDTTPTLNGLSKQLDLINTKNRVEAHIGPIKLRGALKGADIVAILIKSKFNPRTNTGSLFEQNFQIVGNIAKSCIEVCPQAILAIGTDPLNSIIPATNEIYKYYDINNENKIIGIASMDVIQAAIVYANMYGFDPGDTFVPIAGGTSADTVVPIFSEGSPTPEQEVGRDHSERLYNQFMENKSKESEAELASGYAVTKFLESLIRALLGEKDVVETAFVAAPENAPAKYMTSLIDLGENGIETVYGAPININRFEKRCMHHAISNLNRDIAIAEKYAFSIKRAEARY